MSSHPPRFRRQGGQCRCLHTCARCVLRLTLVSSPMPVNIFQYSVNGQRVHRVIHRSGCLWKCMELADVPTTEDMDGGRGLAQVVEVDVVVGGPHCNLVRGVGVVLHAAHVGAQLYGRGWLRLLGRPGLHSMSSLLSRLQCGCLSQYTSSQNDFLRSQGEHAGPWWSSFPTKGVCKSLCTSTPPKLTKCQHHSNRLCKG